MLSVGCHDIIAEGQLRFGKKCVVSTAGHENQFIVWRCLSCISKSQALEAIADAQSESVPLRKLIVVPPTIEAGGDGVAEEVVFMLLQLLHNLSDGDGEGAEKMAKELATHSASSELHFVGVRSALEKKKAALEADTHILDAQIKRDGTILDLLSIGDLAALVVHHHIEVKAFLSCL
jgi:hypothetical protein